MIKKWYNTLPWIALVSGILMVVLMGLAIIFKPSGDIKSEVNRKIAYDRIKQIRIDNKECMQSSSFIDTLENTLDCSVINTKWLISDDGLIIYAKGMMAQSTPLNTSVYSSIDDQSLGLIYAVGENIDTLQKEIMYIAATIRREGEHNDVLGHIVLPLWGSSDELAGFIGVAFELDSSIEPVWLYTISAALIICFLVYWLSIPLWVFYDSRNRDEKYVLWSLFVLIGNLPAYIAYLLSRK